MTPGPRYEVVWTETAFRMLAGIGDRRIQQQLFDASRRLETEPEKQGKPLREGLMGFRSLRTVGQRYRVLYTFDPAVRQVSVVAAGLRRADARDHVYALAQKVIRLGLAPGRQKPAGKSPRKKK